MISNLRITSLTKLQARKSSSTRVCGGSLAIQTTSVRQSFGGVFGLSHAELNLVGSLSGHLYSSHTLSDTSQECHCSRKSTRVTLSGRPIVAKSTSLCPGAQAKLSLPLLKRLFYREIPMMSEVEIRFLIKAKNE